MYRNLPNFLTYFRLFCIAFIVLFILYDSNDSLMRWAAFITFSLCGITDFFDGWLARRWNVQSEIGKILDPIADKALIATTVMLLIYSRDIDNIHIIPAILIIVREFVISGIREYSSNRSIKISVSLLAKWKTFIQILALGTLLIEDTVGVKYLGTFLLWVASALTIYTAYDYLKHLKLR